MLIDVLLQGGLELAQGLVDGRYRRWGGTVRIAAGQPGAGRLVGMLRDAQPGRLLQATPVGLAFQGVDAVVNVAGHHRTQSLVREGFEQVQSLLRADLALSAVSAAASVVNLGVSVVGFTLMSRKLTRLQDSVGMLYAGIDSIASRTTAIENLLVELRALAAAHGERLSEVLDEVRVLGHDLLTDKVAVVRVALEEVERAQVGSAELEARASEFRRVRYALEGQLAARRIDVGPQLLDVLLRFRVWAFVADAEVLTHRKLGRAREAAAVAATVAQTAREFAQSWGASLLPVDEMGGVARFGHSTFAARMCDEQRHRLFTLQAGKEPLPQDIRLQSIAGAMEVAQRLPKLPSHWAEVQLGLGETLDAVEEIVERIEGVAAQADYCWREGLDFNAFEAAPAAQHTTDAAAAASEGEE